MAVPGVVLDANVIMPAAIRDTILRAAEANLFRPLWSDRILNEVQRNLAQHRLTDDAGAHRLVAVLRDIFPEALVTGYDDLIDHMTNDPKDRHVLAAAVRAGAHTIVTANATDFVTAPPQRPNVDIVSPDVFLTRLFQQEPDTMADIVTAQAAALGTPQVSVAQLLAIITATGAPTFARSVRIHLDRHRQS